MNILTLRTDKPEAEIGIYKDNQRIDYITWTAHRQLAETIHLKIKELLDKNDLKYKDLNGIAIYKGPGSFTGLRIGFSVANAISYGLSINIVSATSQDWINKALDKLLKNQNEFVAMPEYGSEPHTTKPSK